MKYILLFTLLLVSCSSTKPRNKWTDPNMRVLVDPDGLEARDYIRVVTALKQTNRFFVVDRRDGFKQILKEQKMIHRDTPDRFADPEKYAHWGKLYSVGAVVTGRSDCTRVSGFFKVYAKCKQNLAIISTISGEVIAVAEGESDDAEVNWTGDIKIGGSWDETVDRLVTAYPDNYEPLQYSDEMHMFRSETKEEAVRQKEIVGEEKATNELAFPTH